MLETLQSLLVTKIVFTSVISRKENLSFLLHKFLIVGYVITNLLSEAQSRTSFIEFCDRLSI
jgi:hypothetical protein